MTNNFIERSRSPCSHPMDVCFCVKLLKDRPQPRVQHVVNPEKVKSYRWTNVRLK